VLGGGLALEAVYGFVVPRDGVAVPLLLWTVLLYGASLAAVYWPRQEPEMLRQARTLRDRIAACAAAERAEGRASLAEHMARTVAQLDGTVLPALDRILDRHGRLAERLGLYERGRLPRPGDAEMRDLRAIYQRQRRATQATLQEIVNTDARLLALAEEGLADERAATEAAEITERLRTMHRELEQQLDADADWSRRLAERTGG
jgi:hypothetical protein